MIIQIDHVAISSRDFDTHIKAMRSLGYNLRFVENDIKNLQIKCGLMRQFSERQNLALLTCEGNIGIELINHKHISSGDSHILPIFENAPEDLCEKVGQRKFNDSVFVEAKLKCFDIPVYIQENTHTSKFRFNKMIIKTRDIKKATIFWECFGFKVFQVKKSYALLGFNSLFSKDIYQIYLQKESNVNEVSFLDDKGFNCIAFISNSIKNEKENLERKGIKVTEIERLLLNQKVLNIFFASGSSGELAEMIGIQI